MVGARRGGRLGRLSAPFPELWLTGTQPEATPESQLSCESGSVARRKPSHPRSSPPSKPESADIEEGVNWRLGIGVFFAWLVGMSALAGILQTVAFASGLEKFGGGEYQIDWQSKQVVVTCEGKTEPLTLALPQ